MNQRVLTPGLLISILLLSLLMMIGGAALLPCPQPQPTGLCRLASPVALPPGAQNAIIGILSTIGLCSVLFLINKRYGLLKTGQPFWFSFTLPVLSALLPASVFFNSSPVVMGVMLIALMALYESYKSNNATRNIFFAASCMAIGSFWQYSFILFIPAMVASLFAMHIARLREFMALLLGLLAPYWIVLGFATPFYPDFYLQFSFPHFSSLLISGLPTDIFPLAVTVGIMMLTALLLTLYNGIKLYAGNSRIRNFNNVVNLLGITASIGLIVDTGNFRAYCGIFAMWVALQLGNLFTLWGLRYPKFLIRMILLLLFGAAVAQILYLYN